MIPEIVRIDRVGEITAIDAKFHIGAVDCEGTMTLRVPGEGWDKGDKGIYKAMTGARKYAIRILFNLATDDDPEGSTEPASPRNPPIGRGTKPNKPSPPVKSRTPLATAIPDFSKPVTVIIEGQAIDDTGKTPKLIYSVDFEGVKGKILHTSPMDCKAEYKGLARVELTEHESGWLIIKSIEYMED